MRSLAESSYVIQSPPPSWPVSVLATYTALLLELCRHCATSLPMASTAPSPSPAARLRLCESAGSACASKCTASSRSSTVKTFLLT